MHWRQAGRPIPSTGRSTLPCSVGSYYHDRGSGDYVAIAAPPFEFARGGARRQQQAALDGLPRLRTPEHLAGSGLRMAAGSGPRWAGCMVKIFVILNL